MTWPLSWAAARALWAWRVSAWYWLDLGPNELMWCTADTGWSKAGTSILFGPWSCGAQVLFYNGRFEPQARFELLAHHRVTVFCAAATELRRLIAEDVSRFDLSALRLAVSAVHHIRSLGFRSSQYHADTRHAQIVRAPWVTPFGSPVEPEV